MKRFRQRAISSLVGAVLLAWSARTLQAQTAAPASNQLPTGGQVRAGSASITQTGSVMNVTQSGSRAVLDWQTFNVGRDAQVNFNQPSVSSVVLNRVLDSNPSQIYGRISAPGQVFFTNPNGMYFSPTSSVEVGGLLATTHQISDEDFMAGRNVWSRHGATGRIVNEGRLVANLGGYIALLAPEVRNLGVIVARLGTVALVAGETYTLQFDSAQGLTNIQASATDLNALIENKHLVQAPEGVVILSANALNKLMGQVINSGQISANSLTSKGGRILLEAGMVTLNESSQLDVRSATQRAGEVNVLGEIITLTDHSQIDARGATGGGTVRVGGDWQGGNGVRQATQVNVGPQTSINASATQAGDGGTVVLWSDVRNETAQTNVAGTITANGAGSGVGGRIETSGHTLNVSESVVVNTGRGGQWLLDPANVTISTGTDTGYSGSPTYTPNSGSATAVVNTTTLQTALNAGTDVSITTTNSGTSGGSAGNITVSNPVITTGTGAGSLSLVADGSISLNANITLTGAGKGFLAKAAGGISQAANVAVRTNGGDITYWADSGGATGAGHGIYLQNATTLDSRTTADRTAGNTSAASGGGSITLGGGTTTTTTALGTVVPTGYALNAAGTPAGVTLGTYTTSSGTPVAQNTGIVIYSGGGNINMLGQTSVAPSDGLAQTLECTSHHQR